MIKSLNENTALKFQNLSAEEKARRGILGRLYGPVASFIAPTRNQRKYGIDLWEKLFNSDLIKERFANGGIFGQLCHPDYTDVDMEKIAVVMPEPPVKDKDGQLVAYLDIIDTPCGRIAYQLARYGYKFGISSRGEGDLITDFDGQESVDPDTYTLSAFDLVEIPAVESARLSFTEALDKKKYNKTLKESLEKTLNEANDYERKIMTESLNDLGINLDESYSVIGRDNLDRVIHDYEVETAEEAEQLKHDLENNADTLGGRGEKVEIINNAIIDENFRSEHADKLVDKKITDVKPGEIIYVTNGMNDVCLGKYLGKCQLVDIGKGHKQYEFEVEVVEPLDNSYKKGMTTNGFTSEYVQVVNDITDESLNINEGQENLAVDNNEAIVEELQNQISKNSELEHKIVELQEKLSVCYAKEAKQEDKEAKHLKAISSLSKKAHMVESLENKVAELTNKVRTLNEQLNSNNAKIKTLENSKSQLNSSLTESLSNKDNQLNKLNEDLNSAKKSNVKLVNDNKTLTEKLENLNKDLKLKEAQYSHKLDNSNKLVEKYQRIAKNAVDKYINSQAIRIGVSSEDIKKRLPESYNFEIIDDICEELQSYSLNINSLPFLNENIRVKTKSSKNESIMPAKLENSEDMIDDDLLRLAGLK